MPLPSHASAHGSVGIELRGEHGNFISLELLSAKLLNKPVLHNVNVFCNMEYYS